MTSNSLSEPQLRVASTIGLPCLLLHHRKSFSATLQVRLQHKPINQQPVLSYGGWITCAGWQAAVTTTAFFVATLTQGMVVENHSDYIFKRWHSTLIAWATILLAVVFNTVLIRALPKFEGMVLVLYILGFGAILIPLVYLAPHSTASEVFTVFLDGGKWNSQGLSFFIGLVGNATAFVGKSSISVNNYLEANLKKAPMEQYMYVINVSLSNTCMQHKERLQNKEML